MFKKVIACVFSVALLAGCGEPEKLQTMENVKIVDMQNQYRKFESNNQAYFEKDGNKYQMGVIDDKTARLMAVGNTVTIHYGSDYIIQKIDLPKMDK